MTRASAGAGSAVDLSEPAAVPEPVCAVALGPPELSSDSDLPRDETARGSLQVRQEMLRLTATESESLLQEAVQPEVQAATDEETSQNLVCGKRSRKIADEAPSPLEGHAGEAYRV